MLTKNSSTCTLTQWLKACGDCADTGWNNQVQSRKHNGDKFCTGFTREVDALVHVFHPVMRLEDHGVVIALCVDAERAVHVRAAIATSRAHALHGFVVVFGSLDPHAGVCLSKHKAHAV